MAVELALDALAGEEEDDSAISTAEVSDLVLKAMSRFHNRLHTVKAETARAKTQLEPVNPFAALNTAEMRALGQRLPGRRAPPGRYAVADNRVLRASSKFGQMERAENSGTITITTNGKPQLEIVWERKREGPLAVRARRVSSADISSSEAEQFFTEVNDTCHAAVTVPLYLRSTLQYEGRAWRGELWLDNRTRLAAPSLQDETATYGPRIVHVDATLDCVGEPDVVYARQQMLIEMSSFLSVAMQSAVRLLDVGRVWTFTPDGTASEVRSLGYLEPANPLSMPAPGTLNQVPLHALDDSAWNRPDNEFSVRADIADLWSLYRRLPEKQRLQFLQAAAKWQEAMIHWQDRPSLSFALMAVACEALKPSDADQRQNCYAVIEALLGKAAVDRVRQNPFPAQHVRSTHLHSGEIHGSELMMIDFMRTYEDPGFREAHREMARVTPAAIVEWLKRRGVFALSPAKRRDEQAG